LCFIWKDEFRCQPFEPVGKPKDSTGGKNKPIPKVATRNSLYERIFMTCFLEKGFLKTFKSSPLAHTTIIDVKEDEAFKNSLNFSGIFWKEIKYPS
jgi:hypothetical protein